MVTRVERGALDADVNGLHFLGDELYTGESVETWKNGVLATLTTYVDGVEEGPHRMWHDNGTLEFTCELHDGNPVGLTRSWRADGSVEEEQQFDDSGDLVWSRRFDEAGALVDDATPRSA